MNCCQTEGTVNGLDRMFNRWGPKELKRFRKKGPEKRSLRLVEELEPLGFGGKTVLDVGCGAGAVHLTMLQRGAAAATGVDAAPGMIEAARTLASGLGQADRTRYILGDMAKLDGEVGRHDFTVMDRVVCCYPDYAALLGQVLDRTGTALAMTLPRDLFLWSWFAGEGAIVARLLRWPFRPYFHPHAALREFIAARGFTVREARPTVLWAVWVCTRA